MNVTPDEIMNAVAVLLVLFGAVITVDKVLDIIKKWKAPTTETSEKLDADKRRLDKHDKDIDNLKECNQVLCSGILALLDHELHNGSTNQMQDARDEIMHYLQARLSG